MRATSAWPTGGRRPVTTAIDPADEALCDRRPPPPLRGDPPGPGGPAPAPLRLADPGRRRRRDRGAPPLRPRPPRRALRPRCSGCRATTTCWTIPTQDGRPARRGEVRAPGRDLPRVRRAHPRGPLRRSGPGDGERCILAPHLPPLRLHLPAGRDPGREGGRVGGRGEPPLLGRGAPPPRSVPRPRGLVPRAGAPHRAAPGRGGASGRRW